MVRSEIISILSKKIHRKLKKSDLEKILQILEKKSIAFKMSKDLKKSLNEGSMIN